MAAITRRLIAEPLFQFALIGAALFAAHWALRPAIVDPNLIVVDAEVHATLAAVHQKHKDAAPSAAEMDELVDRYVVNETLYREARALQLDHGDQMIRERLAQRMRLLIYNGLRIEAPSDETLKTWLAEREDAFRRPATVSLKIVGLDAPAAARARDVANRANAAGDDRISIPGAPMVDFSRRPRAQMEALLGAAVVEEIVSGEVGVWRPVKMPRGWQVARFEAETEAEEPSFEEIANQARARWMEARRQIEARATLDSLKARYPVERRPYDPTLLREAPTAPQASETVSEIDVGERSLR